MSSSLVLFGLPQVKIEYCLLEGSYIKEEISKNSVPICQRQIKTYNV